MNLLPQLVKLLQRPPQSVEIVPSDWATLNIESLHSPFLFQEGHLGIPKSILHRSYIRAASVFEGCSRNHHQCLIDSTSVLLLANPAHQTALNRRKDLVESGHISYHEELAYTTLLQSLPDASKSSILWHHRRWLLRRFFSEDRSRADTLQDCNLSVEQLMVELALVDKAAETYPRNYHAWLHRSICLQYLVRHAKSAPSEQWLALINTEAIAIKRWVEQHVADHSAIQYLCRIEKIFLELNLPKDVTVDHPLTLVRAYPSHESLWLYLREMVLLHGLQGKIDVTSLSDCSFKGRFRAWIALQVY